MSGPVISVDGMGKASINLHINPTAGTTGGRIQVAIVTRKGGRRTTSRSTYNFTLSQDGDKRSLVSTAGLGGTERGINLSYNLDDDHLVITGQVVSGRIKYTLTNIPLQRTAKAPADVPPGGGDPAPPAPPATGGSDSPGAVTFSGDVYSFIQTAVKENRLTDVDVRGTTFGKTDADKYRDVSPDGVLVGFQVGLGKGFGNVVVAAWRPIFRTKTGESFGKWHGKPFVATVTVKAKPDYVVSGMTIRTGLLVDGFTLTFAKLGKTGLDLTDTYQGTPVGGSGGSAATIGGKGELFVGITGYLGGDKAPCALGLVSVRPKE